MYRVHRVSARLQFVPLADRDRGFPVLLTETTVACLRAAGHTTVSLAIDLPQPVASEDWLTVTEAAELHVQDSAMLTLSVAKACISRACRDGLIVCRGVGRRRRIEPNSFGAWRLMRREQQLNSEDEELS